MLLGKKGVISLALKPSKTTFTPRNTIMGKVVAYVRPFDPTCLYVQWKWNLRITNVATSKGLVQANNSKKFPIDQYFHDRVTPSTLSPKPLAYDKPIYPSEMPHISTCTDQITDDTNI